MSTTCQQDSAFIATVISSQLLEESIDWIASNMHPQDIFSEKDLQIWAEDNGYSRSGEE